MSITVRYFASLREFLNKSEEKLETTTALEIKEVWTQLNPDKVLPENTLMAINMAYVDADQKVQVNDELAFFPPVTGGGG
ncbi:MAG: MoaD/ThiS family protein [Methylococcales bacterium]|nr:MoaD/ThiS family protein [Methylococcales bacterium]MCK5924650.1 MoaD/ThiS family protein [Methylococcales bacterium]